MGGKPTSRNKNAPIEPLVLLEDEPVLGHEQDELQLISFSKLIAGAAIGTRGPFTIGVYGTWGEGKTSVIKQASSLLDAQGKSNIITVWFNAWQYEHEEHPIVPLVASMVDQIERRLYQIRSRKRKAKDAATESLSKIGRALRAVAYGFSAKAKIKMPGMAEIEAGFVAKDMIDRDEQLRREDPLLDRTLYYNAFEMLKNAVPDAAKQGDVKDTPRIVVFIDDLDRCLPDKAVRLLESIKLILTQPGFIFVLAVDKTVIEHFVTAEFKRQLEGIDHSSRGVQYLDKIIQLPLPLPSHEQRFERYISQLLKRDMFDDKMNLGLSTVIEQLTGVLSQGVRHNPRSLVRLINNLIVDRTMYAATPAQQRMRIDEPELTGLFAVTRILQAQLDDELFVHLVRDVETCRRILLSQKVADLVYEQAAEDAGVKVRAQELVEQLLRALDRAPHLFNLLKTAPGKVWLDNREKRHAVTLFLAETRKSDEEDTEEILDQRMIVDQAICKALGLDKEASISEAQRMTVKRLDLAFSPLDNEGLTLIGELTVLRELLLDGTQVTDLKPLAGLTALRTLSLARTQISDLRALGGLILLRVLRLNGTQVTDLWPLAELTELRELWLTGARATDPGPPVSDEDVDAFKQTHPKCSVFR